MLHQLLAALSDELQLRDYAYFLVSMLLVAFALSSVLLMMKFPALRRGTSRASLVHSCAFILSTASTTFIYAYALVTRTPILGIQNGAGPVRWSIFISVLLQTYFLSAFIFFQLRDIERLTKRETELGELLEELHREREKYLNA